jgi:non-specific serine/threonine protein kinase
MGETRRVRDKHAAYYVRLVETAEPELLLQNQVYWFKLLQAEYDNLRSVIEWSVESDQAESALRLVGVLLWFLWSHGSIHEARDFVLKALAVPTTGRLERYRARALNTSAYLHWVQGEMDLARQKIEEALSILRHSDDEASLAWSLQISGMIFASEGNYELADETMKAGVALSRKLADYSSSIFSLAYWGDIALQQGDRSKASRIYKESADMLRAFGNKVVLAYPLRRLGYFALERNDVTQAWDHFSQSLELNREVGDERAVAACLTSMAALALHLDQPGLAARLYGAVESRLDSLSTKLLPPDEVELERVRTRLCTLLDDAAFASAFDEGWELNEDGAIVLVKEMFR